jgi:hypothetical protein
MKKQVKFFAMAALAATTVFVSCNKDDETVNGDEPVAVKFATTSATGVQTRVSGASWDSGDPVGIYMLAHGTSSVSEGYANVQYASSAGATATFSPTGATIYYPQNAASTVDFLAYHPYQPGLSAANRTYAVNVAAQTSQSAIDLMLSGVADNSGAGYDKTYTGNVNLLFAHKLVKLNLTVQTSASVMSLSGLSVKIKGMNTTADFDLASAAISNEGAPADITPKDAGSYIYEAILLPVAALGGSHEIAFTIGSDVYTWELSGAGGVTGGALAGGAKYDYIVTLEKHGVNAQGTITPWNSATGTGIAD